MLASAVASTLDTHLFAKTEHFEGAPAAVAVVGSAPSLLATLATFLLFTVALLLIGKFLWNEVLVKLVPAVKPADSIFQILGLSVLLSLMLPGCCVS